MPSKPYDPNFLPDPGGNFFDQFDDDLTGFKQEVRAGSWEPSWSERWKQNFNNALDWSPERAAKFVGDRLAEDEDAIRRQRDRELEYEQMAGSDSLLDYVAAVGGTVGGTVASPTSWISTPLRIFSGATRLARPLATKAVEQGVSTGLSNLVTDVAAQGGRMYAGVQDRYNPLQTALAGGLGAGLGAGAGAFGAKMEARRAARVADDAAREIDAPANPFDQFDGEQPITREELARIAPGAAIDGPIDDALVAEIKAQRLQEEQALKGEPKPVTPEDIGLASEDLAEFRVVEEGGARKAIVRETDELGGEERTIILDDEGTNPYLAFQDAVAEIPPERRAGFVLHEFEGPDAEDRLAAVLAGRQDLLPPARSAADDTAADAPYIAMAKAGQPAGAIQQVILNGPAAASIDSLRRAFPAVEFLTADEAAAIMAREVPTGSRTEVKLDAERLKQTEANTQRVQKTLGTVFREEPEVSPRDALVREIVERKQALRDLADDVEADLIDAAEAVQRRTEIEAEIAAREADLQALPPVASVSVQPMVRAGQRAEPVAGRQAGTEAAQPTQRIEDIIEDLIEAAPDATAFRQGRMTARAPQAAPGAQRGTVAGQFSGRTGVVRVANVSDLEAVTHEIAHAWETETGAGIHQIMQANRAEVEALAYAGTAAGERLSEGFAEFVRHFVINPAYARAQAPTFAPAFEAYMRRTHPDRWAVLERAQAAYRDWTQLPTGAAVASDIVSDRAQGVVGELRREARRSGFGAALSTLVRNIYSRIIDKQHPISAAVQELLRIQYRNTGQRIDLRAADDASKLARLALDSSSAGMTDLMYGVVPFRGITPAGPSLFDALRHALGARVVRGWDEDLLREFGAYLVSRRAIHEYARFAAGEIPNPPGKFSLADYQQAVADFEAANPTWVDAAGQIYAFQQNMLRKKFEAGFLTQQQFDAFSAMPDYVPFQRDMADFGAKAENLEAGGVSGGKTGRSSIVQAFRGSQRAIINPLESIMKDALETANLIARNQVFGALDNLAQAAGQGGGSIAERIPATAMTGTQVNVTEVIEQAARQHGLNARDAQLLRDTVDNTLGPDAMTTIFRPGEMNEAGEPIIYVWRNGQRVALRLADGGFGKELYTAMVGLGKQQREWLADMVAMPTAVMQAGITKAPEFIMANYLRDQASAWILGGERFIPFVSGARGVASELMQDQWSRLYAQGGGIFGGATTAGLHKARVDKDIQSLRRRGYVINRVTSVKGLFEITEISETGTRLALFRAAFERARGQGLSEHEALIEAAFAARDYMDFGRHGSAMLTARRIVPFLNAALQGLDKSTRVLIAPFFKLGSGMPLTATEQRQLGNAARGWVKVATLGLLGLGLRALYKDDPEYEELGDRLRATHWMVKGTKPGEWYAIPKPFELAVLSALFERSFEYAYLDDPLAWERLRHDMGETVIPPHRVPALDIAYELSTNYSLFREAPIVPETLRGLEPALQWNARTSEFGKKIGGMLNVSPLYVDHAITGFGGSWGRQLLEWSNNTRPNAAEKGMDDSWITRRFIKDVSRGATSTQKFWKLIARDAGEWEQVAATYTAMSKNATLGSAGDYLQGKDDNVVAYAILKEAFKADAERLHPLRRAKDAVLTMSKIRQEMALDQVKATEDAGTEIRMTPTEKGQVDDVLSRLSMMESRNALITSGVRGWAQKKYMDTKPVWKELEAASPTIHEEMLARYQKAKVYPEAGVRAVWSQVQERLLKDRDNAFLGDLITDAKYAE